MALRKIADWGWDSGHIEYMEMHSSWINIIDSTHTTHTQLACVAISINWHTIETAAIDTQNLQRKGPNYRFTWVHTSRTSARSE